MPVIDTVAKFRAALVPHVNKLYDETGKKLNETFKDYMEEGDTSDIEFTTTSIVGFGKHVRTGEVGQTHYDSLTPGRTRTITWHRYTLGWRASDRLMREAAKTKRVTPALRKFMNFTEKSRRSVAETEETIAAAAVLNLDNPTASSTWIGADVDGVAFVANNHPTIKGGLTWTNLSATPLSAAAVQAAISMMATQPDEAGQISARRPARYILLVGPALEFLAYQIMETDQVMGSNNNDTMGLNKYKSRISVLVNPYLDASDMWALIDATDNPLHYFEGLKPTIANQKDFETSAHLFKSEFEFGLGLPMGGRGIVAYPGS